MANSKINYQLTIQSFLKSVLTFLEGRIGRSTTMWEFNASTDAVAALRQMLANPRQYCMREDMMAIFDARAFARGGADTGHYRTFAAALNAMRGLYDGDASAAYRFLTMVKRWNYLMSKNSFKDLYYPFLSPMRFAVKREMGR